MNKTEFIDGVEVTTSNCEICKKEFKTDYRYLTICGDCADKLQKGVIKR